MRPQKAYGDRSRSRGCMAHVSRHVGQQWTKSSTGSQAATRKKPQRAVINIKGCHLVYKEETHHCISRHRSLVCHLRLALGNLQLQRVLLQPWHRFRLAYSPIPVFGESPRRHHSGSGHRGHHHALTLRYRDGDQKTKLHHRSVIAIPVFVRNPDHSILVTK